MADLKTNLRQIIGIDEIRTAALCTVTSVDFDFGYCVVEPIDGSPTIYDVIIPDYNIPKIGSTVVVTFLDETTAFVSYFTSLDNYSQKSNIESLDISNNRLIVATSDVATRADLNDEINNVIDGINNSTQKNDTIEFEKSMVFSSLQDITSISKGTYKVISEATTINSKSVDVTTNGLAVNSNNSIIVKATGSIDVTANGVHIKSNQIDLGMLLTELNTNLIALTSAVTALSVNVLPIDATAATTLASTFVTLTTQLTALGSKITIYNA